MYTRIPDSRDILLLRAHIREGTLIDVGANVGLVSLLLADRVQHGLLFEPNPIAAERARQNLALNGLKFEVHELADAMPARFPASTRDVRTSATDKLA